MGLTIHYQGKMDDITKIEVMEDRLLDLVYSLGGRPTLWRSFAEHDSSRVVRGLMIDMVPGQDTFSLLVSPEGDLIPLFQIEDAENGPLREAPTCFVKTQFGSIQGHVVIVFILEALKQHFFSNLTVIDESDFYQARDINELVRRKQKLQTAVNQLSVGFNQYGLNSEAAEDPNILAKRIERIAALVHQKLQTNSASSDIIDDERNSDDDDAFDWREISLEEEVDSFDRLRRLSDGRSERMTRRIREATKNGLSIEDAFELAMKEEGLAPPSPQEHESTTDSWDSSPVFSPDLNEELNELSESPAVQKAHRFAMQVDNLIKTNSKNSSFHSLAGRASLDLVGALVQATESDPEDVWQRALAITQLKRALSSHAYACGAVFGLCSENAISEEDAHELHEQLQAILNDIHELSEAAWGVN